MVAVLVGAYRSLSKDKLIDSSCACLTLYIQHGPWVNELFVACFNRHHILGSKHFKTNV